MNSINKNNTKSTETLLNSKPFKNANNTHCEGFSILDILNRSPKGPPTDIDYLEDLRSMDKNRENSAIKALNYINSPRSKQNDSILPQLIDNPKIVNFVIETMKDPKRPRESSKDHINGCKTFRDYWKNRQNERQKSEKYEESLKNEKALKFTCRSPRRTANPSISKVKSEQNSLNSSFNGFIELIAEKGCILKQKESHKIQKQSKQKQKKQTQMGRVLEWVTYKLKQNKQRLHEENQNYGNFLLKNISVLELGFTQACNYSHKYQKSLSETLGFIHNKFIKIYAELIENLIQQNFEINKKNEQLQYKINGTIVDYEKRLSEIKKQHEEKSKSIIQKFQECIEMKEEFQEQNQFLKQNLKVQRMKLRFAQDSLAKALNFLLKIGQDKLNFLNPEQQQVLLKLNPQYSLLPQNYRLFYQWCSTVLKTIITRQQHFQEHLRKKNKLVQQKKRKKMNYADNLALSIIGKFMVDNDPSLSISQAENILLNFVHVSPSISEISSKMSPTRMQGSIVDGNIEQKEKQIDIFKCFQNIPIVQQQKPLQSLGLSSDLAPNLLQIGQKFNGINVDIQVCFVQERQNKGIQVLPSTSQYGIQVKPKQKSREISTKQWQCSKLQIQNIQDMYMYIYAKREIPEKQNQKIHKKSVKQQVKRKISGLPTYAARRGSVASSRRSSKNQESLSVVFEEIKEINIQNTIYENQTHSQRKSTNSINSIISMNVSEQERSQKTVTNSQNSKDNLERNHKKSNSNPKEQQQGSQLSSSRKMSLSKKYLGKRINVYSQNTKKRVTFLGKREEDAGIKNQQSRRRLQQLDDNDSVGEYNERKMKQESESENNKNQSDQENKIGSIMSILSGISTFQDKKISNIEQNVLVGELESINQTSQLLQNSIFIQGKINKDNKDQKSSTINCENQKQIQKQRQSSKQRQKQRNSPPKFEKKNSQNCTQKSQFSSKKQQKQQDTLPSSLENSHIIFKNVDKKNETHLVLQKILQDFLVADKQRKQMESKKDMRNLDINVQQIHLQSKSPRMKRWQSVNKNDVIENKQKSIDQIDVNKLESFCKQKMTTIESIFYISEYIQNLRQNQRKLQKWHNFSYTQTELPKVLLKIKSQKQRTITNSVSMPFLQLFIKNQIQPIICSLLENVVDHSKTNCPPTQKYLDLQLWNCPGSLLVALIQKIGTDNLGVIGQFLREIKTMKYIHRYLQVFDTVLEGGEVQLQVFAKIIKYLCNGKLIGFENAQIGLESLKILCVFILDGYLTFQQMQSLIEEIISKQNPQTPKNTGKICRKNTRQPQITVQTTQSNEEASIKTNSSPNSQKQKFPVLYVTTKIFKAISQKKHTLSRKYKSLMEILCQDHEPVIFKDFVYFLYIFPMQPCTRRKIIKKIMIINKNGTINQQRFLFFIEGFNLLSLEALQKNIIFEYFKIKCENEYKEIHQKIIKNLAHAMKILESLSPLLKRVCENVRMEKNAKNNKYMLTLFYCLWVEEQMEKQFVSNFFNCIQAIAM